MGSAAGACSNHEQVFISPLGLAQFWDVLGAAGNGVAGIGVWGSPRDENPTINVTAYFADVWMPYAEQHCMAV